MQIQVHQVPKLYECNPLSQTIYWHFASGILHLYMHASFNVIDLYPKPIEH